MADSSSRAGTGQLVLPFGIRHDASFKNFFGEQNARILALLKGSIASGNDHRFVYLAGPQDSGKTHLSIASLNFALQHLLRANYVSLSELESFSQEDIKNYFESVRDCDLLLLEDIDLFLGEEERQRLLFDTFNFVRDAGKVLVVTSRKSVDELSLGLADLASRLRSGLTLKLNAINDSEKKEILMQVSRDRGLDMAPDLAEFLIRRSPRNLGQLIDLVVRLDQAAWVAKQKLTIPFIKKTLGW